MARSDVQAFYDAVLKTVEYFEDEYDLKLAECIGVLELIKLKIIQDTNKNNE